MDSSCSYGIPLRARSRWACYSPLARRGERLRPESHSRWLNGAMIARATAALTDHFIFLTDVPGTDRLSENALRFGIFFCRHPQHLCFHYHDDDLTPFIETMSNDRVLNAYLGAPDGNTLNSYAAEPFPHSFNARRTSTLAISAQPSVGPVRWRSLQTRANEIDM